MFMAVVHAITVFEKQKVYRLHNKIQKVHGIYLCISSTTFLIVLLIQYLAVLSSIRSTICLSKIDSILKQLHKFYWNSLKILKLLKKSVKKELYESEILKFQYVYNIKWVTSKVSAMAVLNFLSILIFV